MPLLSVFLAPDAHQVGAIRVKTVLLILVAGPLLLLVLAVAASALSNIGLPTRSSVLDHLADVEKARVAEYLNLVAGVGSDVWPGSAGRPGWGDVTIPVIVHNEAYAFLLGYPGTPPAGWVMMPRSRTAGWGMGACAGRHLHGTGLLSPAAARNGGNPRELRRAGGGSMGGNALHQGIREG